MEKLKVGTSLKYVFPSNKNMVLKGSFAYIDYNNYLGGNHIFIGTLGDSERLVKFKVLFETNKEVAISKTNIDRNTVCMYLGNISRTRLKKDVSINVRRFIELYHKELVHSTKNQNKNNIDVLSMMKGIKYPLNPTSVRKDSCSSETYFMLDVSSYDIPTVNLPLNLKNSLLNNLDLDNDEVAYKLAKDIYQSTKGDAWVKESRDSLYNLMSIVSNKTLLNKFDGAEENFYAELTEEGIYFMYTLIVKQ